jgi:hypothetical protein
MICLFCGSAMNEVYDKPVTALHKIIRAYSCVDCQQPLHDTYYKAVCDAQDGRLYSDQFVIDKFYIYRSYANPRTSIYKNIAGFLKGPDPSAITLYPPVCTLIGIIEFNLSNIKDTINKLNVYVTFS